MSTAILRRITARWALPLGLAVTLGSIPFVSAAQAYWEAAVEYIEANRYEQALAELNALIESRPGDSFLLRLKGFTLIELDRDTEAVPILERAVELDPEDSAAHYYLGQAYGYIGYIGQAIERLEYVVEAAPSSPYAEPSQALLVQLYNLAESTGEGYSEPRGEVSFQVGWKYDDNVPARADNDPDATPTGSQLLTLSGYGKYEFLRLDELAVPLRAGFELSGYQSDHMRDAFEGYDLTSGTARLFAYVRGDIGEKPFTINFDVGATRARLDGERYSEDRFAGLFADVQLTDSVLASFGYRYTDLDFEDDTEFPGFFSRDGEEHVATLGANVYLLDNRLILGANFSHKSTNTRGSQFEVSSDGFDAFAYAVLPKSLELTLTASYSEEDYEEFVPDPTRLDDVWTYGLTVARGFGEGWRVALSHTVTEAESNRGFAAYDREITELSLRHGF